MGLDEYNGDNFDHGGLGFIGGGYIALWTTNRRPMETHPIPGGIAEAGSKWRRAVVNAIARANLRRPLWAACNADTWRRNRQLA